MPETITINDQPISASFFGEGRWLTEFITPHTLEVRQLHEKLTQGIGTLDDRLLACWDWVANEVKYVPFVKGQLRVNGHISTQEDYWQTPSMVIRTKIGNCANKAFLLTSLLRNELPPNSVLCVLGNLYQDSQKGGHAWVEVKFNGKNFIMESTRGDMQPMVVSDEASIYESVVYFNDKMVSTVQGRTVLEPFCAVYASWLKDYLDWVYIQGRK